jgi:hypothetical protein
MKTFISLAITMCLVAGLSYAEKFNGKLMDAACYNSNKVASQESGHKTYHSITKTCAPTASTTTFAVRVTGNAFGKDGGNTIKLDESGNAQALAEMRSGALQRDHDGDVHIRVSGKLMGETLKTASVKPGYGHVSAS